jgi:hypothetical protein
VCLASRSGHEPLSEQRLATGGENTPTPARRPGRRTDLERGLDGGRDELRGRRVNDDVPAEQHAADDPPGVRGHVLRADAGGGGAGGVWLGHTRDVEETAPAGLIDMPALQHLLRQLPRGVRPVGRPQMIMS